jgi:hypothetical protein
MSEQPSSIKERPTVSSEAWVENMDREIREWVLKFIVTIHQAQVALATIEQDFVKNGPRQRPM